jgi:single-strand DNA-binding protein
MISDLNRTVHMGFLGADAKQNSPDAPVTFRIATADKWTDDEQNRKERTDWHNIVVFGPLRTYAAKFKKGDRVYVEGKLRNNTHTKEIGGETVTFYNCEIHATEIERVSAKTDEAAQDTSFEPEPSTTAKKAPAKSKK